MPDARLRVPGCIGVFVGDSGGKKNVQIGNSYDQTWRRSAYTVKVNTAEDHLHSVHGGSPGKKLQKMMSKVQAEVQGWVTRVLIREDIGPDTHLNCHFRIHGVEMDLKVGETTGQSCSKCH